MEEIKQKDNGYRGKFVLEVDEQEIGELKYIWSNNDVMIINHTGVDKAYGGKGYAKKLVNAAIEFARKQDIKISPVCPYARKIFDNDKSLNDIRYKE